MSEPSIPARYNAVAVFLHWLIAVAIIGMLALGWVMTNAPQDDPNKFVMFQLHKSVGITILLLSLLRLIWRLMHKTPALPSGMKKWEKFAAQATHWVFYALIIIMPFTGWMLVSTSKHNIPTLLYWKIPWPQLPILSTLDNKSDINDFAGDAHCYLAFIIAGLLVLHVGAAWKHHLINRDDVLLRMAPKFAHGLLRKLGGPKVLGAVLALYVVLGGAPAQAKEWVIDYSKSQLGFTGGQDGKSFDGHFKSFQVTLDFDINHPEQGSIKAIIPIAGATTGDSERDTYLPQGDWFDVKDFPEANFASTSIKAAVGKDCFDALGNLTIKGISKPTTLSFCLKSDGDHWVATGKAPLLRTDYKIGAGQWAGDDLVKHAVDVTFTIVAKPK